MTAVKPGIYGVGPNGGLFPLTWHKEQGWKREQLVSICMQVSLGAKIVLVRGTSETCPRCQGDREYRIALLPCPECGGWGFVGTDYDIRQRLHYRGYWNVEVRDE